MTKLNLTQEQVEKLEAQTHQLLELAQQQLAEHKAYLREQVIQLHDKGVGHFFKGFSLLTLLVEIKELKLLQTTREEAVRTKKGEDTISIVYDYPDTLYEFLCQPFLPGGISLVASGGISLDDKPAPNKA